MATTKSMARTFELQGQQSANLVALMPGTQPTARVPTIGNHNPQQIQCTQSEIVQIIYKFNKPISTYVKCTHSQ